jgi:peroxiredoxin
MKTVACFVIVALLCAVMADPNTREGQQVPSVTFKTRIKEGEEHVWRDINSDKIFKGKRVVVFSLPGAFTPTCSSQHLPSYDRKYHEFKQLGIDEVVCTAVNDAFVMNSWGKELGVKNVLLIPDGNAEFTHGMNMLVQKENLGFGARSWRYSMLVDDGKIVKQFIEPGFSDNCSKDPYEISDPDTMIKYLKENKQEYLKRDEL